MARDRATMADTHASQKLLQLTVCSIYIIYLLLEIREEGTTSTTRRGGREESAVYEK
jgi:hypothetical protein